MICRVDKDELNAEFNGKFYRTYPRYVDNKLDIYAFVNLGKEALTMIDPVTTPTQTLMKNLIVVPLCCFVLQSNQDARKIYVRLALSCNSRYLLLVIKVAFR